MEENDFLSAMDEFEKEDKLSTVDTSNFSPKDKLLLEVKEDEVRKHINLLESQRGEQDDETIDIGIKKAKLALMEQEDELIGKYKPVPTDEAPKPKTFDEASIVDEVTGVVKSFNEVTDEAREGILAPFKPQAELGINYLKKIGNAIGGTAEDVWNWIARDDVSFYDKQRELNKIEQEALDVTLDPQGKAILKPSETAGVVASLIPITKPAETLAAIEGGLAYAEEFEETGDIGESVKAAGVATGLTLAGGKLAEKFFPAGGKAKTDLAKQIDTLGADDKIALNKVLDNLDANDIKRMDENARDKLINEVMAGKKSTEEIASDTTTTLTKQKGKAQEAVNAAYEEANKIARDTEPVSTQQAFIDAIKTSRGTKPEKDAIKQIKVLLKGKNLNAEDMEIVLRDLKSLQRGSTAGGKNVYGKAIESVQAMQDEIGGTEIYKKARELSKEFNIDYTGAIKGKGGKAGKQVADVLDNEYSYNIGEKLVGKNIDPNKIGKAVEGLSDTNKMQVVQDLLSRNVADITTPDGVSQLIKNYNKIDPKGMEVLIGKKQADKLRLNMDSIATVEASIKTANKTDAAIGQELLDIATAASMVQLSPFLAAKSTSHAIKKIVTKKTLAKQRTQLVARIKDIEDKSLKRNLMKAVTVLMTPKGLTDEESPINQAEPSPDAKKVDVQADEKVDSIADKIDEPFTKEDLDNFEQMINEDTKPKQEVKWGRGVVDAEGRGIYSKTRPSSSMSNNNYGTNMSTAPRNVQNNNLGNIKHNPNNNWEGQTKEKKDGTFVSFETPEHGVRALARVVKANINATNSIEQYVNRYASEPKEKEYYKRTGKLMPHLQNYAKVIASSQGIRDIKKMPKDINMKKWIKATAVAEGGGKALKYFTDDVIERGINMS